MEKVKRNVPYVLFISLGLKLLILGSTNIFDTLALLVLGLGLAFFELRLENQKFHELSNKINNLEQKDLSKAELIEELRKTIGTIKAVQGFKQQNIR